MHKKKTDDIVFREIFNLFTIVRSVDMLTIEFFSFRYGDFIHAPRSIFRISFVKSEYYIYVNFLFWFDFIIEREEKKT